MTDETSSPNETESFQSKEPSSKFMQPLLFIILGVALVSGILNVIQLVSINKMRQYLTDKGQIIMKLDNLSKSVDGMTALTDENRKFRGEVNGIGNNVNTLTEMVRDLNANSNSPAASTSLANSVFHLHFICNDASSGQTISPCPIKVQVLTVEPTNEFEVQGNDQDTFSLPLRLRLSVTVRVSGYKPYANVFEFTETGSTQDYVIKVEK